jgi:pimeloyl-ACP methyl ester carboxylesterase
MNDRPLARRRPAPRSSRPQAQETGIETRGAAAARLIVVTVLGLLFQSFQSVVGQSGEIQSFGNPRTVSEDSTPLRVEIQGHEYALDSLVVRRPGTDKLPVALITHGNNPGNPRGAEIDWVQDWTHDLAHRGWLAVGVMRRGYGRSEGETADESGNCSSPDVGRYIDANADDLEAALKTISHRPDADMRRVIAIGHSVGGAAVLALAARQSPPISAVINISGGYARRDGPFRPTPGCEAFASDLVWNFARFGRTAHMPTLWLYSENDSWFSPGLVSRMRAAFTGSGGNAELILLPPFQADGHKLFFAAGGKQVLLPRLDSFLRANGLPTWSERPFEPLLTSLSPNDRQFVEDYLGLDPTEKALAREASGSRIYSAFGYPTRREARKAVLTRCRKDTGADCKLLVENFFLLARGRESEPHP